jgi:hypothetical protein
MRACDGLWAVIARPYRRRRRQILVESAELQPDLC